MILLVVIGHILPGILRETFVRYMIYSVHIPIFLGISGYLLNLQTFKKLSMFTFLEKYGKKLIRPWFIAVLVYTLWSAKNSVLAGNIIAIIVALCKNLVLPWYHLWYIPAFISYLVITKIVLSKFKIKEAFILLGIVAIILLIATQYARFSTNVNFLKKFFLVFQFDLYIYFYLGMLIRMKNSINTCKEKISKYLIGIVIISLLIRAGMFFMKGYLTEVSSAYYLLINIPLLLVIVLNSTCETKTNILVKIGQNSLPIYLWHIIFILLVKYLLHITGYNPNGTLFVILSCLLNCLFIYFVTRKKLTD
ncbi:hypothetical protein GUT189_15330 [Streptococcus ruminantium]|nr:hypothetical protein GUT189_15330 [Streptococcus ruminantium]